MRSKVVQLLIFEMLAFYEGPYLGHSRELQLELSDFFLQICSRSLMFICCLLKLHLCDFHQTASGVNVKSDGRHLWLG